MLALPQDVLYLLVILGAFFVPVLIGTFVATSHWIAPGIDRWYQDSLQADQLAQYEAELDAPIEGWDDTGNEIVSGEVVSEPRQWRKGKEKNGKHYLY